MHKPVYIVGDIHGRFDLLQQEIKRFDLRDCTIICVGDLGIGFMLSMTEERIHRQQNEWFARRGIMFYSIRGNHDDPSYFTGEKRVKLQNFELIEDYTSLILNDEKFLFVGGAASVDRWRLKEGVNYWESELFVLKPELITECDVLITHSAPSWNGPFDKAGLNSFTDLNKDTTIWGLCVEERCAIDTLIRESKAKMQYCGHFHSYHWVEQCGCYSTILGILQFKEHRMLIS